MRVLIHGINFAPELTGVGKYTGEMAEWLASRGHNVRVVTAPPYYPEWRVADGFHAGRYSRADWRGTSVWRCPLWVPREPGGLNRIAHLLSFALTSLPVMVGQAFWRPDVVWVAEPTLFSAPAAWLTARLSGAKLWLHAQDLEIDAAYELQVLRGRTIRRGILSLERWLLRRFDRVSSISGRMLELIENKGVRPERLVLFPNWADPHVLATAAGGKELRRSLDIADSDVVMLCAGTMNRKQGLDLVVNAARALRDQENVVFVFSGDGPARSRIEESCTDLQNVRFLDLQPAELAGGLLRMADVHLLPQEPGAADLVLPSRLAGMLASGRPVIATCSPDTQVARIVADSGLLVPPEDLVSLVEAILRLAHDAQLRTRLGTEGRKYAETHLERDRVLSDFESSMVQLVHAVKSN